jgi:di-heme oxidoreductase (putative peroxidase)
MHRRGFSVSARTATRLLRIGVPLAVLTAGGFGAWAVVTNLGPVNAVHDPAFTQHSDACDLTTMVQNGQGSAAFTEAFEAGDTFFSTFLNALDGVGANVGQGQRFTRTPRADLAGAGEWANHTPARATGPNSESCAHCHLPPHDGSGPSGSNVHRDPQHSGILSHFIERNTPHLFGGGAIQRLAEEMTDQLQGIRQRAINQACSGGGTVTLALVAKGVSFGTISATRTGTHPCTTTVDTSNVLGVSADLVVRPFQWKGTVAFIRDFNRGAAHNELGMQAVEIVGDGVDGDFDGVADELSVGDMSALAVYIAAQPRPTSQIELNNLGLLNPPLTSAQINSISRGLARFNQVGCNGCHVAQLKLANNTFSEPSQNPNYRDTVFPAGQDPVARCVDPNFPITFDLTKDIPENIVTLPGGGVAHLGNFEVDSAGRAIVRLFGDLKRHDMGPGLAETIDEEGTGASVFLTENLWGVGSTAPYMHDGRDSTLTEAILEHGGEATASRNAFVALTTAQQQDLVAFLNNLVLFEPAP